MEDMTTTCILVPDSMAAPVQSIYPLAHVSSCSSDGCFSSPEILVTQGELPFSYSLTLNDGSCYLHQSIFFRLLVSSWSLGREQA
ncbi:hypothetical protein GDO81_022783 [Engystomops pustulosus]|uniref:Uncharacterized protein n=1 Tax=Engystomops pustulosus TaxID=76066 RepID=A0AAV6Z5Q6_ENGPU|nr:hypothetical protein GDO81_022783 [Engystomops pustulosus]